MKTLSFALIVALTATLVSRPAVTKTIKIVQVQKAVDNKPIDLKLPKMAKVLLRDGKSLTGYVTAFKSKSKKEIIEFSLSGEQREYLVVQVKQIIFSEDPGQIYHPKDPLIILGGQNDAKAEQSIWSQIPIEAFKLVNAELGEASINLATVKTQKELQQIRSVAIKSSYIVNEIEFTRKRKMTIKVTPR